MPEVTDRAGRVGSGADAATERDPVTDRDSVTRRDPDPVTERVLTTAGLGPLVAEAEAVWRSRATSTKAAPHDVHADLRRPVWRPFEDAFPTFYQFTNRPPR